MTADSDAYMRAYSIEIEVTLAERAELSAAANRAGITVAAWVRMESLAAAENYSRPAVPLLSAEDGNYADMLPE